ncbi:MAG TPA: TetR/AcrR family transcriptional regulator [Vicinamibacteria bacterium]|nr:TetR/AcrR family transcriptional regulator [Vicinamibacteria bacterium]
MIAGANRSGNRPQAPARHRERRDPEATRRALLAAGAALFSERGYDAVPIEAVADRAGVNKALISYHFQGKRGLYATILASAFQQIAGRLDAAEREAEDAPAALRAVLDVFAAFRGEHPEFPSLFLREVLSSGVEPAVVPHLAAIVGVVRRIALRGAREGTLRRVDPLLMHFALMGALVFFAATEPARSRAAAEGRLEFAMPDFADFRRYLEELTLRGLRPDPLPGAGRRARRCPRLPPVKSKGARS